MILSFLCISLFFYQHASDFVQRLKAVQLQPVDTFIQTPQVYELIEKAHAHIAIKGNYQKALEIIIDGLDVYGNDWYLQAFFGSVVRFYAGAFTGQQRDDMIEVSQQCFTKLNYELFALSYTDMLYFTNEYAWSFGLYQEQYQAGVDLIDYCWDQRLQRPIHHSGYKGYCWQGLGATYYAQQLYEQGDYDLAYEWAEKAVVAWAQYLSYKNDFYGVYVHYGLALGILGYHDEMMKALERGAKLIQKDLNFFECKNVINWVDSICV